MALVVLRTRIKQQKSLTTLLTCMHFFPFICKMGNYHFSHSFYLIIKRLVLHIQPVYRHRSEPSVHGAIVTERGPALGVTRRGER